MLRLGSPIRADQSRRATAADKRMRSLPTLQTEHAQHSPPWAPMHDGDPLTDTQVMHILSCLSSTTMRRSSASSVLKKRFWLFIFHIFAQSFLQLT